jgi:hypothetical protein
VISDPVLFSAPLGTVLDFTAVRAEDLFNLVSLFLSYFLGIVEIAIF